MHENHMKTPTAVDSILRFLRFFPSIQVMSSSRSSSTDRLPHRQVEVFAWIVVKILNFFDD